MATVGRLGRVLGIVAIFAVVGPLTLAALVSLIVIALGAPLLQLLFAMVDLGALQNVISTAVWLLAFVVLIATFLPSAATGLFFALAAIYGGTNGIWTAWLCAAAAIAATVLLGANIRPSESSAVILPSVESLPQALSLSATLAALAVLPTSLCWWLAKPLHRASVPA
jgi:hypothetical protein